MHAALAEAKRVYIPAAEETFLPARRVWERYSVTSMTLHRWLADDRMGFPRPIYLGRFRYWRLAEIEAYERALAVARDSRRAA